MTRLVRRWLPWTIALLLFIWIWFQIPWFDIQLILLQIPLWGLIGLLILDVVIVLLMSSRWWFVLQGAGISIGYLRLNRYRLAATGISYFTPGPQFGGEPFQVWVLTHYHQIKGNTAVASVTVDKLLELMLNFTVLLVGVVVVVQTRLLVEETAVLTIILITLLWSLPILFLIGLNNGLTPLTSFFGLLGRAFSSSQRMTQWINKTQQSVTGSEEQVIALFQKAPKQLLMAFLMSCLNWALWFGEFWLVYALLDLKMGMLDLLLVLTAARIAFLFPLPTGLGTLEASQLIGMAALNQPLAIGLSATLIIRLRDMLLAGIGIWLGSRLLVDGEE